MGHNTTPFVGRAHQTGFPVIGDTAYFWTGMTWPPLACRCHQNQMIIRNPAANKISIGAINASSQRTFGVSALYAYSAEETGHASDEPSDWKQEGHFQMVNNVVYAAFVRCCELGFST